MADQIVKTEKLEFGLDELAHFLVAAKKACWAKGDDLRVASQRPDFKEYEFMRGRWNYRDSYAGSLRAGGGEVVRCNGVPIWMMNYFGGMSAGFLNNQIFAEETFDFLRSALLEVKPEKPFRGPEPLFRRGKFTYNAKTIPDPALQTRLRITPKHLLIAFNGEEKIYHLERGEVFWQNYYGGLLSPKTGVKIEK